MRIILSLVIIYGEDISCKCSLVFVKKNLNSQIRGTTVTHDNFKKNFEKYLGRYFTLDFTVFSSTF